MMAASSSPLLMLLFVEEATKPTGVAVIFVAKVVEAATMEAKAVLLLVQPKEAKVRPNRDVKFVTNQIILLWSDGIALRRTTSPTPRLQGLLQLPMESTQTSMLTVVQPTTLPMNWRR